jgi:pimeloyl-ACP methyl ester carboxylesterase
MVPPNIFKNDHIIDDGEPNERHASYNLQFAGFLVFQVETRLAPPVHLPNQLDTDKGYAPEQTDDLKRQILAALADTQCNGSIYLVGGSAGGCLALWCALDSATGAVTGWNDTVRQKIKAVVSLSGVTRLCDWMNPGNIPHDELIRFEMDLDNYVGLQQNPPDQNCSVLDPASPYTIVSTATSSPPVLLYATIKDPMPYEQMNVMYQILIDTFGNPPGKFTKYLLPDTTGLHAFNYWHTQNPNVTPSDCVSHQVITFLQANP